MGELIGPEKLKELRAEREELIKASAKLHPSAGPGPGWGEGMQGLIDNVRRLSEDDAREILEDIEDDGGLG